MILSTKEDFEKAVLSGEEIKYSKVFYTGEIDTSVLNLAPVAFAGELEQKVSEQPKIGDYNKDLGVFAGYLHGKQVWVGMKDEPEQMTWDEAMKWAKKNKKHIPTIDELTVAYLHKDEINASLEANGGEPFKEDDWYRSSSECSSYVSWILYMISGTRGSSGKLTHGYVRVFQLV